MLLASADRSNEIILDNITQRCAVQKQCRLVQMYWTYYNQTVLVWNNLSQFTNNTSWNWVESEIIIPGALNNKAFFFDQGWRIWTKVQNFLNTRTFINVFCADATISIKRIAAHLFGRI